MAIISMGGFSIDPDARIGQVHLKVSDIGKSLRFYESFLGFKAVEQDSDGALLSIGGKQLVVLSKAKSSTTQRQAGLYHFAVLLPQRKDLGRFLSHLLNRRDEIEIDGFSDHFVSEAIYIRDPDHIGIEVYRDRPDTEWVWSGGQVRMTLDPLDMEGLLAESDNSWTGLPAKTTIGHVHLHVSDLTKAKKFYSEVLGLTNTASMQGALFFAAGNYHHHIATNVWLGKDIPKASAEFPGLDYFTLRFSDKAKLEEMMRNLQSNGMAFRESGDNGSFLISDHDEISILLE